MDKASMEFATADQPPAYSPTTEPIGMGIGPPPVYSPEPIPVPVTVAPSASQTIVIPLADTSQRMNCPYCKRDIMTKVEYKAGSTAAIYATILCLLGFWCCVCIPFCSDSVMDVDHRCPSCFGHIGTYKR